jgi:hypothetical protein
MIYVSFPWVHIASNHSEEVVSLGEDGGHAGVRGGTLETRQANAKLIASIPEMIDTLQAVLKYCNGKPVGVTMEEKKRDFFLARMGVKIIVEKCLTKAGVL